MRGMIADNKSPIVYGYTGDQMPIYFSQDPVSRAQRAARLRRRGGASRARRRRRTSPPTPRPSSSRLTTRDDSAASRKGLPTQERDGARRPRSRRCAAVAAPEARQQPLLRASSWPSPPSPTTCCSPANWPAARRSAARALALDQPLGKGHVVMFALRPFWRWQTQGTYALGFNTIINWDHLDAGKAASAAGGARRGAASEAAPGLESQQ